MDSSNGFKMNKVMLAVVIAIGIGAAGTMVLANADKPAAPPGAPGPAPISAAQVVERAVSENHEFSGRLEAVDRVEIRPRVSGFITAINFKQGSQVKKGDTLFVIDPRPYEAEANRAEATELSINAKLDLAKLELARAERLLAEKAIPQREVDSKSAAVKELTAERLQAHASLQLAQLNMGFTQVKSPIDGRVSKAEVTLGNLVDASNSLTSVVSSGPIYASFEGDEETYLRVTSLAREGLPVVVKIGLANEAGFPHEGKLDFIDNRVDPVTGSVRMRATLDNDNNALAPGLFARVQLSDGGKAAPAALILDSAVGTDQNHKFVYVLDTENKAVYRTVTLGPLVGGMRVVRQGVAAGEKIVVNGLQRVRPGKPVKVQMVQMDPNQTPVQTASDDNSRRQLAQSGTTGVSPK